MRARDIEATQRAMLQEVPVKLLLEELWRRLIERADVPFDASERRVCPLPPLADDDER